MLNLVKDIKQEILQIETKLEQKDEYENYEDYDYYTGVLEGLYMVLRYIASMDKKQDTDNTEDTDVTTE